MPAINVYGNVASIPENLIDPLKSKVAELLSCKELQLKKEEFSVRLIDAPTKHMIGEIECDIFAHHFPERIEKQDQICNEVRIWLKENLIGISDARVWLALSELGHSF